MIQTDKRDKFAEVLKEGSPTISEFKNLATGTEFRFIRNKDKIAIGAALLLYLDRSDLILRVTGHQEAMDLLPKLDMPLRYDAGFLNIITVPINSTTVEGNFWNQITKFNFEVIEKNVGNGLDENLKLVKGVRVLAVNRKSTGLELPVFRNERKETVQALARLLGHILPVINTTDESLYAMENELDKEANARLASWAQDGLHFDINPFTNLNNPLSQLTVSDIEYFTLTPNIPKQITPTETIVYERKNVFKKFFDRFNPKK